MPRRSTASKLRHHAAKRQAKRWTVVAKPRQHAERERRLNDRAMRRGLVKEIE